MAGPGMETPNELMVVFSNTVTAGFDALSGSVNGVFGLLIALVVALTGIQWALSPNREVLASGFGKVLLIGAFAWIINDWQALSETIYAGFLELGLTAGGGALSREEFLNPGAILQQGWEIVKALGETPAPVENPLDVMGNMADALILGLAMIGIMLAFAILALQIIVSLLEFKIVTLGGFVLLPFGIWNKTAFLAERPLGYVVSSGLKVLALAIVVSGARTIFDQLQPSANPDIYEALTILVAALLLAMLAIFIPNLASALVTGGPALGAGAALTGGLAVAGAGALVAGGAAGAGAMAGRAAAVSGSSRSAAGATFAARPSGGGPSSGGAPSGGGPRPSPGPGPGSGPAGRTRDPAPSGGDAAPTSGAAAAPGSPTPAPSKEPPPQPNSSGPPPGKARTQADTRSYPSLSEDRPVDGGAKGRAAGRSAALQAFFIANSGRALMPAGENSGALKPTVRNED
ncbi:P-type conjugative transfer protein TrbL [Brevundimonas sp.]|uniref:P-type conjugative transfer protein TrbL n=1 Tax=Brevundimonas sp. TaxID=1871086 RepID=UPI0025B9389E|nr:P-type conjugative transfer protein TrbL [Brevundimonas sp.]